MAPHCFYTVPLREELYVQKSNIKKGLVKGRNLVQVGPSRDTVSHSDALLPRPAASLEEEAILGRDSCGGTEL